MLSTSVTAECHLLKSSLPLAHYGCRRIGSAAPRFLSDAFEGLPVPLSFNVKHKGPEPAAWGPVAPTLVALHGLLGSKVNWAPLLRLEPFSKMPQSIYTVDVRNHGASPHSDDMDYETLANDLIHFLDSQNIAETDLLGHSMGGKIAMQIALRHPERVSSVAICDISPVEYHSIRSLFRAIDTNHSGTLDEAEVGAMVRRLRSDMSPSDLRDAFCHMDKDSDGQIDFEEFFSWWKNHDLANDKALCAVLSQGRCPASFYKGLHDVLETMVNFKSKMDQLNSRPDADALLKDEIPMRSLRQYVLTNLVKAKSGSKKWQWRCNEDGLLTGLDTLMGFPLKNTTPFEKPAVFIAGGLSEYIAQEHESEIYRLFPKAKIVKVPGADHNVHLDSPQHVNRILFDFLSRSREASKQL